MQRNHSSGVSLGIGGQGLLGFQNIAMVRGQWFQGQGFSERDVVCDSMTPGEKLDLLLHLVLGKGQV